MFQCIGYAAHDAQSPLAPFSFTRRALRPRDVAIEIVYCGVCHSDLHYARDDWGRTAYPCVPGHEIVGRVTEVGPEVTRFKRGDHAAVGCMVDSCRDCSSCAAGLEQYCNNRLTATYNGKDRQTGEPTLGGYSDRIVVTEDFVLRIPEGLDLARVAPLLCAGITTYSPLRHWKVGPGQNVGVVGLGGLGHMGVKLARALGAEVTMITTSPDKEKDARALGAHGFLLSTDKAAMAAHAEHFDFVLNTIPVSHDVGPYMALVRLDGAQVLVGALDPLEPLSGSALAYRRKTLAGSIIGGIAETQEMLDFCAEHDVLADCETIAMQDINAAYDRLKKGRVKYRFVIDMASLKQADAAA
ncbi:NAD(P)-dependent alcohol dehydrogenase [Lichenihabitans sp. Uapishka_5]|uniref:NAD(P)-dependent alcohol dehydrogenase n=1 Tax=Lichenihabitans sp. Uapishka_5 TaxID=3037302 RepID=UPI0029E81965|nr:NAD(P)-dependent alcohol dehydrogenase [Lichenihabitans sp. Uapishka_5]MDX7951319.1 NAD(P)-dependent alcohol dehydrogenase [Lichenihabitans sp. Uapishka_5]